MYFSKYKQTCVCQYGYVFNLLILTDHFYLYIRNLFLAVAHEQTPHIARILSLLRDAITEDDDDDR